MKSIRTNPTVHAGEGDERIRTAVCDATTDPAYEEIRYALSLIRDGRCSCGGRFKWTGVQLRCEQCDQHEGWGIPKHYRDMAGAALARAAVARAGTAAAVRRVNGE